MYRGRDGSSLNWSFQGSRGAVGQEGAAGLDGEEVD